MAELGRYYFTKVQDLLTCMISRFSSSTSVDEACDEVITTFKSERER